jgi:LysM repeat protein
VIIEGEVFYMHVVKAGQTLYSICKAYDISEDLVVKENPGSEVSLRIGQLLKIPVNRNKELSPTPYTPTDTTLIMHVVKPGETMFSISKYYNVSITDLEKCNPLVINYEIKTGQVIYIPRKKTEEVKVNFISHKVKRRETIYGISKKYNISEDMLKQYNPELLKGFPRHGEILKIPVPGIIAKSPINDGSERKDTIPGFEITSYDTVKIAGNYSYYLDSLPEISGRAFNVAYLIPFNYRPFDEIIQEEAEMKVKDDIINLDHTSNPNDQMLSSRNFLEFLEGSLLAIDSLKNEGISVNVFVFDTKKSPTRIREIINQPQFRKMDLIIGPFYSYEVEIVSEFSRLNRVPMISPLSGELGPIQYNPFFFQLNTGYKTEYERMADYISGFRDKNIVFIHAVDSLELFKYNFLKENLLNKFSLQSPDDSVSIKEVVYDLSAKTNFLQELQLVLAKDTANLVVIPETDEAFVSTVMSQLYFQLKNCNITVLGMPHWNAFQNIDFMYFHKLSLSYFTPYYFNYDSANVKHFLKDFRKTYYAEPVTLTKKGGSYAFIGYDLSYHFLKSISKYGKRFILHLNNNSGHELMNSFYFVPVSEAGGFENRSLMLVKFTENLEIHAEPYAVAVPVTVVDSSVIPAEPVPLEY